MSISSNKRPTALAVFLLIVGVIGFAAAFTLTLDKLAFLTNPDAQLSCNFSVLIGCTKNLSSWQGALFGFPNPLLGIACWPAAMAVALGLLANARFDRWFWILFNMGILGALALVIFWVTESIYTLGVLCPWCMVTWVITIPTFFVVTFYNLTVGNIPAPGWLQRGAKVLYRWVPLISLGCYLIIFLLAQLQLDVLHRL